MSIDLATAARWYLETALWSETDDDGEPLDGLYSVDDIDAESVRQATADVQAFIDGCIEQRPEIFDGMDADMVGYDFWLTRNGHGAGFWDRGLGERGEWLTMMAKPYGEAYVYVGDNGTLYYHS